MDIKEKALDHLQNIRNQITAKGYYSEPIVEREYNYELPIFVSKNKFKVLVYFGKKGLKTMLQGNSKEPAYEDINEIIDPQSAFNFLDEPLIEPESYIGTDETGKGDVFGPLVVGAVYINQYSVDKLLSLGVRDSKNIKPSKIKELAPKISKILKNDQEIVIINPEKYNELYAKFNNLNRMLNWAHSKAAENLIKRTNCKTVITDKFSKESLRFSKSLEINNIDLITETKAEKYTAVAAASILARNTFDKWFEGKKKEGLILPKGASNNIEETITKLIDEKGLDFLKNVAKLHFKSVKRFIDN